VNADNGEKFLNRKYFRHWLKKRAASKLSLLLPIVVSLVHEGFKPRCVKKKNLTVLEENCADLEKALSAFRVITHCTPKRKRGREVAKDERPNKRARKEKEPRPPREPKKPKEKRHKKSGERDSLGQTHDMAEQFQKMSLQAYPGDAVNKILEKKYSRLILDGNNILFVTDLLRSFTLKGNREKAEKMLSIAAFTFSQLVGISTEIIFDATSLPSARNFGNSRPVVEMQTSCVNSNLSLGELNEEVYKFAKNFPPVGIPMSFFQRN